MEIFSQLQWWHWLVGGIILIVAAGGGFKQTLVDTGIGKLVAKEQPAEPQWERIEAGGPPDKIRQVACGGKEK